MTSLSTGSRGSSFKNQGSSSQAGKDAKDTRLETTPSPSATPEETVQHQRSWLKQEEQKLDRDKARDKAIARIGARAENWCREAAEKKRQQQSSFKAMRRLARLRIPGKFGDLVDELNSQLMGSPEAKMEELMAELKQLKQKARKLNDVGFGGVSPMRLFDTDDDSLVAKKEEICELFAAVHLQRAWRQRNAVFRSVALPSPYPRPPPPLLAGSAPSPPPCIQAVSPQASRWCDRNFGNQLFVRAGGLPASHGTIYFPVAALPVQSPRPLLGHHSPVSHPLSPHACRANPTRLTDRSDFWSAQRPHPRNCLRVSSRTVD